MRTRSMRWLAGALIALALLVGLAANGTRPSVVYGADPTPTPTPLHTDGQPGGSGGGGGG